MLDDGRPNAVAADRPASFRELEMVFDETLRKYPPAWVGPRRARRAFEFAGHTVPGAGVRQLLLLGLPPPARRVSRARGVPPRALHAEAKAALPKGAYVPFGGGSRTCIGMRFGQLEIRTIATLILARFTLLAARQASG